MKTTLTLLSVIAVLTSTLLAFNPGVFSLDNWTDSHQDAPVVQQMDEALSMPNTLILDIGIMVSDDTPETGVAFTYTISYSTQSLVEDADNPVIEVPLPNGIQVVSFVGNAEVGSTEIVNVMGTPTFRINMKNPLEAGAAGILMLELVIPPGQVCDGTVIPAAVTFSADDADNSPVSDQIDIIVSAPNEEWNVNVNAVTVGVPGSTSLFQLGISPSAVTGFIALDNATLTAEIPANTNVVNCSGCMQSGTTLTWDVSNASGATSFPLVLEFPSPPFDFSDNFSIEAMLDGTTISDCPVNVDDTDTYNGILPSPNPLIQCGVGLSTFEIGDQGGYVANADVTGNVEVDDFTATITIPQQIQITGIRPSSYLFEGLPVTVTYETNLGGPFPLGSFNTTLDGSAGDFTPPVLGAGEFLTTLVYEFGTVPPGFGPVNGIVLDYEVLAIDQLGNPVIGANPRITNPVYVSCPNAVYTCISPVVEVSANYEGEPVPNDLCDDSAAVTRIPPVGPDSPNKSASGNVFFVGDEVTYTLSFNVCGPDPLVNGLVTDDLPAGVNLVPGSVAYSSNITDIGTPALNQIGSSLTWDFSGIDLPGSTDVEEDCGATYTIEYTVEVTEVANGPGSSTLNNTFTIDGDDVDIAPEAELPGDEDNITIPPIGPTNLSKTSLNGSDGNPEDTITFRLRFRNQGPFDVNNVVIVDELPMGLDFVPGTIQYNGGLTPADNDGMVYNSGNRTLTFEWASLSGSAPGERYSEFYEITYDVAIPRGFPPGPLQNCFTVSGTGDYIRQDLPLEDCETFTVNALVQTSSRKGVRGDCDADFVFFDPNGPNPTLDNLNGIGRTFQGGAADWKLIIENTGNVEVKDITVIDIMPFIGDEAVSFPADRESEWRTNFVEVISMPANATVEYSIEPNPCRADFSPAYEPAGCTGPFWSTAPPVDVTETQALKFFLPTPLGPGEQTEIVFSTQAPVDAPEDAIAWNSLAYQGRRTDTADEDYFLVAEPNKVGIAIKADTVSVGNYVWSDDNMDGIQNEPAELGINGVSVDLYRLVGTKDAAPGTGDDVFVGTKLTGDNYFGNPGYYLFANLPEGQYYAVFDENSFPPGQVPPADMPTMLDAGGNDVVDSDADQTTMFMTDLTPALTETGQAKDTTLDLGLIATDCDLFPTVMVMCDDRGTAQVNDDRYTWTLQVNREINSALDNNGTFTLQVMNADGLEIDVVPDLAYGVEHPIGDEFGPFPISGGDLMFEVKDDIDLSCEAFGTVEAPATLNIATLSATDCVDDGMGNLTYNLTGQVQIGGDPAPGARLEVFFTESGNTESQIFDPIAEDGNYNFSFIGLVCDGESFDVEARFIDGMGDMIEGTCTGERRLHEPCYLAITDIQIEDNCRADGTYTVNVIGTYYNGTGDMEISIAGNSAFDPATQTLDLANRADGVGETLASFTKTCDGQLHEVTASFNGSCMDTENFEGPRDRDFGDVPDTYGTTLGQNGAFHIIHDDLFLGNCVDSELDGSPEAQAGVDGTPAAGAGTGGDDGSGVETEMGETAFSECVNDDEDGIRFLTSMVPGNEACVEVTATNNTGSLAALQMWVDFDGNGSFSSGEEVAFTEPIVGTGTNTTNYCFEVPASATFPNLETFVRVRLSSAGGLDATGPANDGEVEDYYLAFAKIGDFVWEDLDYDGIQDAGEPGIPNAEVSISGIDLNSNPFTASTTTTGSGMYMFSGLFPGDYMLNFTTPNELVPTTQGAGNDDTIDSDADAGTGNTITYTLNAGDNNLVVDAGFFIPAIDIQTEVVCVDGYINVNYEISPIGFTPGTGVTVTWVDPDVDTVVSVLMNQPLSGTLLWPGTILDNSTPVDWPGWELVDGVWELVDDGLRPSLRLRFEAEVLDSTVVTYPSVTPQCDPNPPLGELGDYVWEDLNGNGIQEMGEPPVANVTVNLLTENGDLIETTMTDANGLYLFDSLGPANFIVEFITPGGYEITPADNAGMDDEVDSDAGGDGRTDVIMLGSGETNYTIDAGIYLPASLGSTVWEDTNGNGQLDGGEAGVPNVTVSLFTCVNGVQGAPYTGSGAVMMTDANGQFNFTGLPPGSYTVVFDYSGIPDAADYIYTLPNIENNTEDTNDSDVIDDQGNVDCVTLESDEDNPTIYAGIYPDEDGDLVPDDIDPAPGVSDPTGYIYCESSGEIIPGGSISVTGPGPVTLTEDGSNGFYGFVVVSVSGTYNIQFTPPTGYIVSVDCMEEGGVFNAPAGVTTLGSGEDAGMPGFLENSDCGSNPFYYSIDLEPGVFVFNNNIPLSCASIGDLVWEDDNLDGVQGNDEAGVPDVQVVLFECNNDVKGDAVDTTLTDSNGNYIFTGLPGGVEYCVLFDVANSPNSDAAAYQLTTQDQTNNGGDDTNDSDPNTADGCTPGITLADGQAYEDFDAGLFRLDYGDLDEGAGFPTTDANNGAAHSVPTNVLLKLGNAVDAEPDGQSSADALGDGADEDGVILPLFSTGIPVDVPVELMNMTGGEAKLAFFIDWNNDGDFDDTDEMYDIMVPDNATGITFEDITPPLTAAVDEQIGVRFRISTDMDAVMSPTGIAPDGEVEDYLSPILGLDYGDLNDPMLGTTGDPNAPLTPADYATLREDNGPRHVIVTDPDGNPTLKIGAAVDDEANGQPSADAGATAGGDDNTATPGTDPDDEDGLDLNNIPLFILTQTTTLEIPVMNMTGSGATLALFLDFNKDGAFDPMSERFSIAVPANATTVSIDVDVPVTSVVGQDLGLRIRLANDPDEVATAQGEAQSGEVEDYMVQIVGFDYGDLPVSYGTEGPDAPKHIVNEDLLLGQCVDVELDGQPDNLAEGDDNGSGLVTFGTCNEAGDDENGIDFITPLVPGTEACVSVTAVNNTGQDAVLQFWIDWDGDGSFGTGEEVSFSTGNTVPNGGLSDEILCFDVPEDATFEGGSAYSRARLSPEGGLEPDSQAGEIPFGEIEDYEETLYLVGSYVWEDLDGDGLQGDFSNPCFNDLPMELEWAGPDDNLATEGDNRTYMISTGIFNNIDGKYVFEGLIPGTYALRIPDLPTGYGPTLIGAGSDGDLDSNDPENTTFTILEDGSLRTGEDGTGDAPGNINGYPDGQDNLSFDFGFMTDGYEVICNCDGSVTLDWEPFATGDTWTVDVEDENGNPVVDFVNMPSTQVTFVPGTLMNGTCYNFAITENLGNAEVESIIGVIHANCNPIPVLTLTGEGPSCPSATDGSITIDLDEQGCSAVYDVFLIEAGVGEQQVGTGVALDMPFVINDLGEGTFRVRLELVDRGNCAYGDGCLPDIYEEALTLENTDDEAPVKTVTDQFGNEPDMTIAYGSVPEGECGVQFQWSVELEDNCENDGVSLEAQITTVTANPSVSPSASVTVNDNEPVYTVDVHAGIGTNTLLLIASDANGNADTMTYEITVADNRAPEIYGPGDMQVQIPACEDSAPVNWQVSAIDDCDLGVMLEQASGPESGSTLAPGTYTVVYEATDDYGNTSQYSFDITVTQAQSPAPIVDVSGNGQFVIEDCAEDGFIVFSGHIYDCELQPGDVLDGLISIIGAPLEITYILVNEGYAYFEATGNLSAGSYLIVASYEGITVDHGVEVVQDADTPAVMTMPGNLAYQVPNCEGEAAVSFAVQLEDDCDEDFGTASFTVNGAPAPPFDAALSDPANGYFAWSLNLPPGVYTIVGTYTDGGGNTTEATATVTVNADEDNSAPIIVYPSQNITEVLDPCGPDEAEICFQATAIDDCEGDIVPTVTVTGPGGVAVPVTADGTTYCFTAGPGQYTVSIGAADAAGNSTSEAFGVSVTQDDAPEANLACNDDINVTLDENCSRVVTADMVLEGNFGCLQEDDFTITIVNDDNPANGNILDGHGQWIYEITGPDGLPGFQDCWGFITGEDKTAPVVDCPDDTDVATISESVQKIQGALETTDAQLELADYSCFLDGAGPVAGGQYYDLIEFQVSADDIYTIYLNTSWGDGFTALYQGSFNADNPCENILYAADDNILGNAGPIGGLFDPQVRVTLPLRAYETYFVLVSSFGSDVTGSYEHTIFSDGNGLVGSWNFTQTTLPDWTAQFDTTFSALPSTTEQLSIPLFCDDFDQIYGGDAGSVAQETAFIQGTYQWAGAPSATDNCDDNVDITATDSFTSSGDCGDVVITRTFTATDGQGLTDDCQQQITVRKPTLDDVNLPSFTAVVECDEDYPALANGNPSPELTGYPFIFTAFGIFDIAPSYCNIGASYEDLPTVDECEGRFKFRREWTIFDWCDPGSSLIANQLIKVGDYTAPEVSCPAGTPIAYSTSPFSCGASFEVPMPGVSDNCSNVTVYTEIVTTTEEEVINQYGLPTGQFVTDTVVVRTIQPGANRFVSSIPFGGHFFRYVAEDDCGNETELYCPFSVIDQIEPVAVCDDQLNVSIGGGNIVPGQPALARVFASDVDEGSWDNCGDVSIAIFRNNFNPITYTCGTQNSVTGDFVDFFCCDVGVTSDITLVVTDQYGNQNSCWLSVTPEDKINPFCDAPDNVVVDCDGLPYGFDASDADQLEDLFGMATGADNCGVATVQQVAANADLECGYGSITRIFRVTDVNGLSSTNSCVQVITINEVHNYEIYFPEDAEANCGTPTPDTVEYNELGCDLLAVTSNDEQFSASGDECYKIFRTWKVINWCQYDGESDPYIVGRDEDCNGTPGDGDRIANNGKGFWLLARPNGKIYFDQDTDETPDNNVPGINFCGTSNDYYDFEYDETGYYQYTQIIKVYDDTAPAISFTAADAFCSLDNVNCDANVTYDFSIDEDCTPDDLTIKVFLDPFLSGDLVELTGVVSGSYPDYTITVNDLPIGSHAFEVHVLDGCGNSDLAILPFDIIDCKAPAPICINGIAIELMPVDEDGDNLPDPGAGMAEIWASDFVDFSTQAGDCSEPIKYSINRVGEPNNPDQTGLVLTCDDEGTLVIEIWAYDAAGNSDFCETYILVQDNMGVCGAAAPMAAGAVNTEDNEPVEDVQVSLSGQASTAMTTQNDGAYVFTNLTAGLDYTITPQRDGDYLNGVSTFDLVLISKHILGVEPLNSPYKRIAADANNSGSITTLDLIQLRKLILSVSTELPNNTSWRFVEASYVFPNPADPWQEAFPEVVNINDLPATGINGADFIAVKIGDVSGDVVANSFSAIDERGFDGRFQLETADEALKSGNEYRIAFTAPQLAAIEGFQGTLEFDAQALELVEILPGTLSAGHFGLTQAAQGRVAMSWNWASEAAVPTDSELFTLVLRARTDVQLSGALGMSDAVTRREAYGKAGTLEDVALHFGEAAEEAGLFVLYQNQPNPFREETVIGFELPEAVPATVTISDVAGRVVRTYKVDGAKGYNQIVVKASDLAAKGMVSYTVETKDHRATKQMMVIE